jgi:hypothetical protein
MEMLFERLSSGQIVAVISIVCGTVGGLALIYAITKYQLRALAADTAQKREKQQAEIALRDKALERAAATGASLDALLAPEAETPAAPGEAESLNAELAKAFGSLEVESDDIAQAMSLAMGADAARKRTILKALNELLEDGTTAHESILAAVRPLCAPTRAPEAAPVA